MNATVSVLAGTVETQLKGGQLQTVHTAPTEILPDGAK
jgi:hypothetical protein